MLHRLKTMIPEPLLAIYHRMLARVSAVVYRNPSQELIVIGVTGTNGKTTASFYLARALEASGFGAGCTTTALMKIGKKEWINKTKMTMPGRFFLQKMMREMVDAGCRYAVIETSSQGLAQGRHLSIAYDVGVFTNLTPEHIEAHGGFENYKKAKHILFEHVGKRHAKRIAGKAVPKGAVLNADSEYSEYYAAAPGVEMKEWYGIDHHQGLYAEDVALDATGSRFVLRLADDASLRIPVRLNQPGDYNISNALAALAVCRMLGVDLEKAAKQLEGVATVPGRFERIDAGQSWTAIVDYAPEPESFKQLYRALKAVPRERTIHVLGSCGGGRDVARRPILGQLAAVNADIVIVTNEDPYDDHPQEIIDQVATGAREAGKIDGENLFLVEDRKEAIVQAMAMARPNDLVVMTGKGCEPWICVADGKKIPWDEAGTAREAIEQALKKS
ncbi:UDP-N-acetylmuramoyl-L-alanyl-D-glutamate--2,6-diaminopimelate ligase [Candidatus Uhrbacteria bacterium]|nr:MAG: UDP-N-acetylmuramoyl-L-alanyl-D-glutamate--2,6-diaminopimelate ligase [Candidatus Uhrbacteria bacterium]